MHSCSRQAKNISLERRKGAWKAEIRLPCYRATVSGSGGLPGSLAQGIFISSRLISPSITWQEKALSFLPFLILLVISAVSVFKLKRGWKRERIMRAGCNNLSGLMAHQPGEKLEVSFCWLFLLVSRLFKIFKGWLWYRRASSGQQINRISASASLWPQRGGLFSSGWEGDEHHPILLTSVIVLYARVLKYHLSELQQVLLMPLLNLSAIGVIHSGAGSFCLFETRINWSIPIGL